MIDCRKCAYRAYPPSGSLPLTGSAPVTLRWSELVRASRRVLVDAMCVLPATPVALGITILLALDARGRDIAAPTSRGLAAQPTL